MATVKIQSPKALTGITSVDLEQLRAHQQYMVNQLNYILNNLDSENILSLETEEEEK